MSLPLRALAGTGSGLSSKALLKESEPIRQSIERPKKGILPGRFSNNSQVRLKKNVSKIFRFSFARLIMKEKNITVDNPDINFKKILRKRMTAGASIHTFSNENQRKWWTVIKIEAFRKVTELFDIQKNIRETMTGTEERTKLDISWRVKPKSRVHALLRYLRGLVILTNIISIPLISIYTSKLDSNISLFWKLAMTLGDILYTIQCIIDARFQAFYTVDGRLITDKHQITARLFNDRWNILYRIIILLPYHLLHEHAGYVRLLMLIEYQDFNMLCAGLISMLMMPLSESSFKYTVMQIVVQITIKTSYLMLFCHVNACIFLLQEQAAGLSDMFMAADVNSTTTRYVTALYALITTQTSVGYGDITINPISTINVKSRYMYQIFLDMASVIANSMYYQLLIVLIKCQIQILNQISDESAEFEDWMANIYRCAPEDPIYNKHFRLANGYFKFLLYCSFGHVSKSKNYIEKLGYREAAEIREITSLGLLDKFRGFFCQLSYELSLKLLQNMKPIIFHQKDIIIKRREYADGIYLILDGEARVYYRSRLFTLQYLDVGDDFGEVCILNKASHYSYICNSDLLCLYLDASLLNSIINEYPECQVFLTKRAKLRQNKLNNLMLKAKEIRKWINTKIRVTGINDKFLLSASLKATDAKKPDGRQHSFLPLHLSNAKSMNDSNTLKLGQSDDSTTNLMNYPKKSITLSKIMPKNTKSIDMSHDSNIDISTHIKVLAAISHDIHIDDRLSPVAGLQADISHANGRPAILRPCSRDDRAKIRNNRVQQMLDDRLDAAVQSIQIENDPIKIPTSSLRISKRFSKVSEYVMERPKRVFKEDFLLPENDLLTNVLSHQTKSLRKYDQDFVSLKMILSKFKQGEFDSSLEELSSEDTNPFLIYNTKLQIEEDKRNDLANNLPVRAKPGIINDVASDDVEDVVLESNQHHFNGLDLHASIMHCKAKLAYIVSRHKQIRAYIATGLASLKDDTQKLCRTKSKLLIVLEKAIET